MCQYVCVCVFVWRMYEEKTRYTWRQGETMALCVATHQQGISVLRINNCTTVNGYCLVYRHVAVEIEDRRGDSRGVLLHTCYRIPKFD